MANLNFINIKNIDCFISEVKKLHVHRQFSDESNIWDQAYNEKVFKKEIEPTEDFFFLLELVKNSNQSTGFFKNRSKVMNLMIKLFSKRVEYGANGSPLVFSSLSRTITWYLSDEMDLFVQILFLQLLASNYFNLNYDLNKPRVLLKDKNILSICGRHAYNPFYYKKALFNINEGVLRDLNFEHDRLKITRQYLRDVVFKEGNSFCIDERVYALQQRRYLKGFKLHLGVNYFDAGLEPLKSYNNKEYKINVNRRLGQYWWRNLKGRTEVCYYHNQIKRWQKTKLGHTNLRKLYKRALFLNYGIRLDWTIDENDFSELEEFVKFSPFISSKTLSPHFRYSYFQRPKNQYTIPTNLNPLPMLYKGLQELNERNAVLTPAEELVRERAKNSTHFYFRNNTLSLLKKNLNNCTALTLSDTKLKLKLYELIQTGERLPAENRAPLIFPVARQFESDYNRFKIIKYKTISIIFDWKEFSVLIKGVGSNLKLIFFLGSLYWDFSKDNVKLTSPIIRGWKPRKLNRIIVKHSRNNKSVSLIKTTFKSFDKNLIKALSNIECEEDLEIELQFKPSTFVYLIKTTLTTNTRSTIIRENRGFNSGLNERLSSWWGSGEETEFGYQESWRFFKD